MIEKKIEKYINENGEMIITPIGTSMWPLIRQRKDTVYIVKPTGRLKKYDVPIYKRSDGTLVLHRVMEVLPDSYTMCGDHQTDWEYGIKDSQIIAVSKGIFRGEKYISAENKHYIRYCTFWCNNIKRKRRLISLAENMAKVCSIMNKALQIIGVKHKTDQN